MSQNNVTEAGLMENFVSKLLKTKNPDDMLAQSKETGLNKTLNWVDLIILGIGAVIGAGIFSMVGTAVVGAHHDGAGPAIVISMVIAAIACIFSALCYAEFASMIPVSGGVYLAAGQGICSNSCAVLKLIRRIFRLFCIVFVII